MNKKLTYEQPSCDLFVVKFERGIMAGSPDGSWDNSIKSGTSWGSTEEDFGLE